MGSHCDTLYHRKIGFPETVKQQLQPKITLNLRLSGHAQDKVQENKYLHEEDCKRLDVRVEVPNFVDVHPSQVFEAGLDEYGNLTKVGFRYSQCTVKNTNRSYDEYELVIIANPRCGTVITVYMNRTQDNHSTLDSTQYNKPSSAPSF